MQVDGASLATEQPRYGLADNDFEYARAFQNRIAEWVHEGTDPVAVLRAPTGAGKTVTFHELIDANNVTLLVYPTNALLRQQRNRFEAKTDAVVLTGATLEGSGRRRTRNLLETVNQYAADHEVVLTNPDILQAVVQNMYRGEDAMDFFDKFDAIVYDEFHFYDALAASGLLLQAKIIAERHRDPKLLLASATPNEDFVEFLRDSVGLDVRGIKAEYVEEGDQFRQPVDVHLRDERRILDQRTEIAKSLETEIDVVDEYDDPGIVLVFNSVRDSNKFHEYLAEHHRNVFKHAEKDNGFDTGDERADLDETDFYILNTTSKGEVGLDYDITTLYMENPGRAGSFLQRFGRAGRESEATVHVFGLDQWPWGEDLDFPAFADEIYEAVDEFRDLDAQEMPHDLLADLVGFRGAYALADRENERDWVNPELREDFATNVEKYGQWRGFIEAIRSECAEIGEGLEPAKYTQKDPEARMVKFTRRCFDVFRGLRGQSLSGEVKYPRGDRLALTTYDLTTSLRHYEIDHVEDGDVLVLRAPDDDDLSVVTARLPVYETEPVRYDEPTTEIESDLQTKIHRKIDRVEGSDRLDVSPDLLHRFFQIIRITDAVVPERITTAGYDIEIDNSRNAPPSIDPVRR